MIKSILSNMEFLKDPSWVRCIFQFFLKGDSNQANLRNYD